MGRVLRVPRPGWAWCFGGSPAQARTRTVPYCASSTTCSALGGASLPDPCS
jgi:hypothetical protein